MNKSNKRYLSFFLAIFLAAFMIMLSRPAYADSSTEEEIYQTTQQTMLSLTDTQEEAVFGNEWLILDLARDEQEINPYYLKNLIDTIIEKEGVLHTSAGNYTNYAKVVLALTSLGIDPTDIAGYNLIEPVSNILQVQKQGVNGVIYALLALDCNHYDIQPPENLPFTVTRENYIKTILANQLDDGGWDWADKQADPDMTAMAIQALAPYYDSNADVKTAVDTALQTLSNLQQADGGFQTEDAQYKEASESTSMVILALTALGINPAKDDRFIKNGMTTIDNLCSFAIDGGFKHTADGGYNEMATDQGYRALVSYHRLLEGKTSFYDMSDIDDLLVIESALSENVLLTDIEEAAEKENDVNLIKNCSAFISIEGKIEYLFDLQFVLTDENNSVSFPIHESDKEQTISITIPADKLADLGDSVLIIGVHDGEAFSITPDSVNKTTGEITFKTSRFSTYAAVSGMAPVVPPEDETTPDTPVTPAKTGDHTNMTIWILLMAASIFGICIASGICIYTKQKGIGTHEKKKG